MGQLRDELTRKRRGGGLLLVLLLAALAALPLLRHRDATHPLSGSQLVDLCPYLPSPPADLVGLQMRSMHGQHVATCNFETDGGGVELFVSLTSTRQASLHEPVRISRLYENWVAESRASGAEVYRDLPGPWRAASAWRHAGVANVVVDDHGILLVMTSRTLSPEVLAAYALKVSGALRELSRDGQPPPAR